jgi:predicted RNase H-like HicB family nuclease
LDRANTPKRKRPTALGDQETSEEEDMNELHYSMVIEWSDEDNAYLVTLPEWADRVIMPATHGETYREAVKNGQEVLELLVESAQQEGEPLPIPKTYAA